MYLRVRDCWTVDGDSVGMPSGRMKLSMRWCRLADGEEEELQVEGTGPILRRVCPRSSLPCGVSWGEEVRVVLEERAQGVQLLQQHSHRF